MIDGDLQQAILYDVAAGRSIADSKLKYTPEAKKFREAVEAEWAEWQKDHPDAVLHVPAELPDPGIKVPKAVAKPVKEAAEVTGADWLAMAAAGLPVPAHVLKAGGDVKESEFRLTEADRIALRAAGHPVPVAERDFSAKARKKAADKGAAMSDGSFPILNASDLANAIQSLGRASDPDAARAHIIKRARALGLIANLPDDWNVRESDADLEEAGKGGDHFYGAWKGGKKKSGGGPAGTDKDKDGKYEGSKEDAPAGKQAGPGNVPFISNASGADKTVNAAATRVSPEARRAFVKAGMTNPGRKFTTPGGKTLTVADAEKRLGQRLSDAERNDILAGIQSTFNKPVRRAPKLPATTAFDRPAAGIVQTAKSRGGPGFDRNSSWLEAGQKKFDPTGGFTATGRLRRSKWE